MKKYLGMTGNIIVYIICWLGVFAACVLAFQKLGTINEGLKQWLSKYFFISFTVTSLVGILLRWLYSMLKKEKMLETCGFKKINPTQILLSIGFGIGAGVFTTSFITIEALKVYFPNITGFFNYLLQYSLVVYLIIMIPDAFLKEIIFRGSIMNELRRGMSIFLAIFVQGIIYACVLLYSDLPTRIYGFAGNIIFAAVFVLIGSLWGSILANIVCSVTIYALGNLLKNQPLVSDYPVVLYIGLIISIIVVLLPFYFLLKKGKSQPKSTSAVLKG